MVSIQNGKLNANSMENNGKYNFYTSGKEIFKINSWSFEGDAVTIAGNGASMGFIHRAKGKFDAYQRTYVLKTEKLNIDFLYFNLWNNLWNDVQKKISNGGIPFIVYDDINLFPFKTPSYNEQTKIANLFTHLDSLLSLHKRKCILLKNIRKSLFYKMFPSQNSVISPLKVQKVTHTWEQDIIQNLLKFERPDKYITKFSELPKKGKFPILTANKSFIIGYTDETNFYNSKCIVFDDFTLDNKYVNFPFLVKSSAIKILSAINKSDDLFFYFLLLNSQKLESQGHARHYINIVSKHKVKLPKTLSEQTKIANLFSSIDLVLSLHKHKF
ncbi:restriction endonuclease subunit S [Mycoplasma sp. 480]|uniref:restriction endonuclease subunit S n=1 Tax=Mycoplasma sp. 480 TaxID=3440155 RepID=UPI003F51927D